MYDTCTILCRDIVTGDYTERIGRCINELIALLSYRLYPWEELGIVHAYKVCTLVLCNNAVRNNLVAGLVFFKRELCTSRIEVCRKQCLCKNHSDRLSIVAVVCLHCDIVNLWTDTESCI